MEKVWKEKRNERVMRRGERTFSKGGGKNPKQEQKNLKGGNSWEEKNL